MTIRTLFLSLGLAASTSACLPAMVATRAVTMAAEAASKPGEADTSVSPIYHYIRSNRDGSEAEHVVHFRPARERIAVYKWLTKCETAAYVTAELAPGRWEPKSLDAGKVAKDGSQASFGRINADLATRHLTVNATVGGQAIADDADVPAGMPWFLYDYDLADLSAHLQQVRPVNDFDFAFAIVWPGDPAGPLSYHSTIRADYFGLVMRDGRGLRQFDLRSTSGKAMQGTLWLDPGTSAIVEAEFDQPNHDFLKDYRLKLERIETGGQKAWHALLKAHYATCPK